MTYPVRAGVATNTTPKLPTIQKPSEKPKEYLSYNNKGLDFFLGWGKK